MHFMTHGWIRASSWAFGLCACGPEVEPVADCDATGPTRLVELNGPPISFPGPKGIRDERGWLFFDGTGGIEGRNLAVECGKAPRVYANDIPLVGRFDEDSPWIGIAQPPGEGADIFVVDPWGGTPPMHIPRHLFGRVGDVIIIGEGSLSSELLLGRIAPEDPFTLDPVPLELQLSPDERASWEYAGQDPAYDPLDVVFADVFRDGAHATIGIDPNTGETVFAEDKEFVSARMGGRFVVLRERDADGTERYAVVETRDPARRLELDDGWDWAYSSQRSDWAAFIRESADEVVETTLVLLPDLRSLRLDGDWSVARVYGRPPDSRHVLTSADGFFVLEPDSVTPRLLYRDPGTAYIVDEVLRVNAAGLGDAPGYALVEVPLDGSPPTVLIEPPILGAVRLTNDRWALQRHEENGKSDLHILDLSTGHEQIVAEGIDARFSDWNAPHRLYLNHPAPTDDLIYATTTGDRTTIWRLVP